MHARTVSLPELASEKRRNTALSLSEGFAGARHEAALSATAQSWAPRPAPGEAASRSLGRLLPLYYRTRQLVLGTEKAGHRPPAKLQAELRAHERALAQELRPLHPLLFQRFDGPQLDRLLRAMPFLRLSQGRWLFGTEAPGAWPAGEGERSFLLLSGRVALFPDPSGAGQRTEVAQGTVFGERRFRLGDECMQDLVCGAARCEEPCIVAVLSAAVLEAAFADRAFGNHRIAQLVRQVPALARAVRSEPTAPQAAEAEAQDSGAALHALRDLARVATTVHVAPDRELLSDEPLEESVLIVAKGSLSVRADVTLVEKLEAIPPKKVRIRVTLDKATNLAGDSFFDKLDPYCVVKLGDFKRFRTPTMWNVGPNPKFDYTGVLTYSEEKEQSLEFAVMDHDKFSADDLCGNGSIPISELHDGWSGSISLTRPKRGIFQQGESLEEPAGKLFFSVRWDFEKPSSLTRPRKERTWSDQELFTLRENDCWGHEQLLLGGLFRRTLEQASSSLAYELSLGNFRVLGTSERGGGEAATCWKASRRRFLDFVRHCGRQSQFTQACRVSSLEKQSVVRELALRLIRRMEAEEQALSMRRGLYEAPAVEEALNPRQFKDVYYGSKALVTVRNALNLTGGGWFDKLDPYAILRFRGSKHEFKTQILADAGSDPVWDVEGSLTYLGEVALEISVWDHDKYSSHDLLATGVLQLEEFCGGFEGMVRLSLPGKQKNKAHKPSMIVIGVQWEPPREPGAAFAASLTGLKSLQGA